MVVLLGPQRTKANLARVVAAQGIAGRIAIVTAGWQEREADDQELDALLSGRALNLRLHARAEQVFAEDGELMEAHRLRQERLMQLQAFYQLRLEHLVEAALAIGRRASDPTTLGEELQLSLEAIRALDRQHLGRIAAVYGEFEAAWTPVARDSVVRHRRELAAALDDCAALVIAGGHVAVLLNRLKLFEITSLIGTRPIFAWSAGAMAVSEIVVLFHDTPPQGEGIAQVFDAGLGLCRGIVVLPSPRQRLRLDDHERVGWLARRFAPAACVGFDDGSAVTWTEDRFSAAEGVLRLEPSGRTDASWGQS